MACFLYMLLSNFVLYRIFTNITKNLDNILIVIQHLNQYFKSLPSPKKKTTNLASIYSKIPYPDTVV